MPRIIQITIALNHHFVSPIAIRLLEVCTLIKLAHNGSHHLHFCTRHWLVFSEPFISSFVLLTRTVFELHHLNYESVFSLFLRANHSISNWFTGAAVLLTPPAPLWCWFFPSPKILILNMKVATHLGRVNTSTLRNQPPTDERILFLVRVNFRARIPSSKCRPCRSRFIGRQRIYGDEHG